MKRAGLTHGGFYAHFGSKDDLLSEAVGYMFKDRYDAFFADIDMVEPHAGLQRLVDYYLSMRHRDAREWSVRRVVPLLGIRVSVAIPPCISQKPNGRCRVGQRIAYPLSYPSTKKEGRRGQGNRQPADAGDGQAGVIALVLVMLAMTPSRATPREGATATNPKTGERIVLRDGLWRPILGPGPHTLVISDGSAMTRMEYQSGPACERARDTVDRQLRPRSVKAFCIPH